MAGGFTGLALGFVGLTLLEVLVSNPATNKNATGLISLVSKAVNVWIDPKTPLVPDLRNN